MSERTDNIRLLLRISKSLDQNYTEGKVLMFNRIVNRVRMIKDNNISRKPSIQLAIDIISDIGKYFNMPSNYHEIKSSKREIVIPKQFALTLIRDNTDLTYQEISELFYGRKKSHSMVMYAHESIDNLLFTNKKYKDDMNKITSTLKLNYIQRH